MNKTPYQEALEIIELLLRSNETKKYEIAKAFLEQAKKKLEPANWMNHKTQKYYLLELLALIHCVANSLEDEGYKREIKRRADELEQEVRVEKEDEWQYSIFYFLLSPRTTAKY